MREVYARSCLRAIERGDYGPRCDMHISSRPCEKLAALSAIPNSSQTSPIQSDQTPADRKIRSPASPFSGWARLFVRSA
jgi:hypothetical protein